MTRSRVDAVAGRAFVVLGLMMFATDVAGADFVRVAVPRYADGGREMESYGLWFEDGGQTRVTHPVPGTYCVTIGRCGEETCCYRGEPVGVADGGEVFRVWDGTPVCTVEAIVCPTPPMDLAMPHPDGGRS
jgi:hypothetical protein